MHPLKRFIAGIGSHISTPQLIALTGKRLVLPFYHVVSNTHLPHIAHLYQYKTVAQFEQDLDWLLQYFEPVSLHQIMAHKPANYFDKPAFHLTFDDGLREAAEVIAPILLRRGIPATFFINSAFIDNKGLFYRYKVSLIIDHIQQNDVSRGELEGIRAMMPKGAPKLAHQEDIKNLLMTLGYEHQFVINQIAETFELDFGSFLRLQKPYMVKSQVRQLIADGFTIGAHSIDHPMYNKLELIEQTEQTLESVHYVQEVFQIPYRAFAFPFTDQGVRNNFFEAMYHHGTPQLDLSFGTAGLKKDIWPQHLQRIAMEDKGHNAQENTRAAYLTSLVQQLLGINRIKRR